MYTAQFVHYIIHRPKAVEDFAYQTNLQKRRSVLQVIGQVVNENNQDKEHFLLGCLVQIKDLNRKSSKYSLLLKHLHPCNHIKALVRHYDPG